MRPIHRFTFATAFLATVGVAGMADTSRSAAAADTRDTEVARIRSHFDSVLTELASQPAVELDVQQAARRATLIRALRDYRDRGVFPHNYDFPGRAVPYFVDRKTGTLCAVANLLAYSGRWDIVDRVAHADNNVRVAQLAGDTAFTHWLDANGLTLAEAARIQMPYMGGAITTPAQDARNRTFFIVAPVAVGGAVASSVWNAWGNADGHRRAGNVVGLVSGALSIALSATSAGKDGVPAAATATGAALGGLSIALGTRGLVRHRQFASAKREEEERTRLSSVSLAPVVSANGGAGLSVALRF
jgi:hypothetical protein